jgi:FkbM family methyltransferase
MIKFFAILVLDLFDYFHKIKIIRFLKKLGVFKINLFFDVGAHKGESIQFFSKNLDIDKIYSFEASPENFLYLKNKYQNKKNLVLENIALSSTISKKIFNQCNESSSSTFSDINYNSKYLKRKMRLLNSSKKNKFFNKLEIATTTLSSYMRYNKILNIDLIKIDTEGHEYDVLMGLDRNIANVKTVIFEHHYDNMIKKNYTFSDIHLFFKKNFFKQAFKIKMPFRKSFEYIYINEK